MRTSTRWLVALGLTAGASWMSFACNSSQSTAPTIQATGAGGAAAAGGTSGTGATGAGAVGGASAGTILPGSPLGSACTATSSCRMGLVCGSDMKCDASMSTVQGNPCNTSIECAQGLYCSLTHTCAPVGMGQAGASCTTDGDCASGLRCDLMGFTAQCAAAGSADMGQMCMTASDCLAGLGCANGVCAIPPPGLPPALLSTWPGETCMDDPGPPKAYFRVPRGQNDGDFYRLPFPNDIRTKNGHPDLTNHPTPGSGLLGFDPVQRYIDAIQQQQGFGTFPTVYLRFSAPMSIDALRATGAVKYVDISPGAPKGNELGYSFLAEYGRGAYICANWLGVRPAASNVLQPGHTYALYVMKSVVTMTQQPFAQDSDFTAMVASSAPSDPTLAAAYQAYAPFRAYLTANSVDPASVLSAAVFTTSPVTDPIQRIATAVSAAAPPATSGWIKCGGGQPDPCPDTTGDRACPSTPDPSFDELHALVTLPIFQQGTAPYLNPSDGGGIPAGPLTPATTQQVCMALTVPKGAPMPASGWPVVVYAHGTGGDYRSHINEGGAGWLSSADSGNGIVNFAVLGIDQVQTGPRRNGSTQSTETLFFNYANPAAALGNPLQGAADQLSLAKLATSFSLSASQSPTGAAISFDPKKVVFWGHSQGATEGGIGVPYTSLYQAAVVSGEGGGLVEALIHKTQPQNVAAAVPYVLQDPDPSMPAQLYALDFHPVLSLLQMYIDPADPVNHAANMAATPPMGVTPKHVFQPFGLNDTESPPQTEAIYALAGQLAQVYPDSSVMTPDPDLPSPTMPMAPAQISGNLTVGMQMITAAVRQYAPNGYDGHFVVFKNADATKDMTRFLAQVAQGKVPQVGP